MKRVAVLLAMAASIAPQPARAQLPVSAAPPAVTTGTTADEISQGDGAHSVTASSAAPPHDRPPGDQYFVEQAPAAAPEPSRAALGPAPFEPPPPANSFEPPPPPLRRHVAPERSFYVGARLGWFIPFGNAWARARPVSTNAGPGYVLDSVPWRDYATSGPMFELNAGMRLSRSYALFALWERARLGSGHDRSEGEPDGGETDFWAAGLRASSNPDGLGFLTEVAVGYRRARSFYENGVELQLTNAPFEARLGLGAQLRTSRLVTWSGLVTIGVGAFGEVRTVAANGDALPRHRAQDAGDGHAWATLTVGGHFDLFATRD